MLRLTSLSLFTCFVVVACNSGRDAFSDADRAPFVDPDAGAPPDAGSCGFRCSRDLKKVLKGCDAVVGDTVVEECPPEKGCGVDTCVDACTAAAMNKGSTGCAFWTMPPDDPKYGAGSCFAAMIANTWDRPASITADWGGDPLDVSKSVYTVSRNGPTQPVYTRLDGPLAPGQVAVVFLAQAEVLGDPNAPACPPGTVPAVHVDPIRHGTVKTKAFHLKTDTPVAAYSIFPYGGADSWYPTATLLLPVASWDKQYIAVSTAKIGDSEAGMLDRRTLQIVADEDGTEVSMRPNTPIGEGEDVAPGVPGEVVTWSLTKGQALQITQRIGPSGSPITSNKPIGVFGGSPCTFIPSGKAYCDLTQQQIAPFSQWGTSYALVPYLSRVENVNGGTTRETVPWSFVGAADGTLLTYDPMKPPGAPDTLQAGQVATFETDMLVTVRSQDEKHPFHASVYMTGSTSGGGSGGGRTLGDPDFVNVVPNEQFLDRYVFFTDFTYPETSLTIVRKKTPAGFMPVKLDCGGDVTGFSPLGSSGEYEYAWVPLTRSFVPQKLAKGECGYGRHAAESEGPFSVTVWGWGKDASYGYAGGMGMRPINDAPLPVVQ